MFAFDSRFKVEIYRFVDNGSVPNSHLPVVYRGVAGFVQPRHPRLKKSLNTMVGHYGWYVDWLDKDAVYRKTHYHDNAHEALLVVNETAPLQLGGTDGEVLTVSAGDAIFIPAGVGHKRLAGSRDFMVAGLYPYFHKGYRTLWQTNDNYRSAKLHLPHVSLPAADPFCGPRGPLMQYWK